MPKSSRNCCIVGWSICCVPFLGTVIFLAIALTRGFGQYPAEIETAAFSNDISSTRVAGIELQYNKGLRAIPLQGWVGPVRPRSRVFIQENVDAVESRKYFEEVYERQLTQLYFMETEGYILLNYPFQSFTRIDIDNGSTRVGPDNVTFAIPSPNGSAIAAIQTTGEWQNREHTVTFLDSTTLEAISEFDPIVINLPRAHRYVRYWDDNESFSVATVGYDLPINFEYDNDDGNDDTVRTNTIAPTVTWTIDGQLLLTPNTTVSCLPRPTSSSTYRDDGGFLFVNWTTEELEVLLPGMENYPSENRSTGDWYIC